jgi:hypothetical protein
LFYHSGIKEKVQFSYPYILLVKFSILIETTSFWESNYNDSQIDLYTKIKGFKEDILTPIGYRKISKILNEEGILTPNGNLFTPSHVFGIYQKGNIRMERVTRKDVIIVSQPIVEVFNTIESLFETYNRE